MIVTGLIVKLNNISKENSDNYIIMIFNYIQNQRTFILVFLFVLPLVYSSYHELSDLSLMRSLQFLHTVHIQKMNTILIPKKLVKRK